MKLFQKHKERVEKIKAFSGKNKVFVIMAVLAIFLLTSNFLFQPSKKPTDGTDGSEQQVSQQDENSENAQVQSSETETKDGWRFYFIDVIILVVGGGFCTVMIIRERRKRKEKLL